MTKGNTTLALEALKFARNAKTVLQKMEIIPVFQFVILLFKGTYLCDLFTIDLSIRFSETKCH